MNELFNKAKSLRTVIRYDIDSFERNRHYLINEKDEEHITQNLNAAEFSLQADHLSIHHKIENFHQNIKGIRACMPEERVGF